MTGWELAGVLLAAPMGCAAAVLGVLGLARFLSARRVSAAMPAAPTVPAVVAAPLAPSPWASREAIDQALAELASVRAEWMAWKKQVETFLEEFDELAETIERRRNRISVAVAKREKQTLAAAAQEAGNGTHPTRDELIRRARAMGIPI